MHVSAIFLHRKRLYNICQCYSPTNIIQPFYKDELVGFIVLGASSPDCAEIFVIGVKKKFHHHGAGRELNNAYEDLAKNLGYTYTQVKTVQSGHYDEYDITNKFYKAVGYKELEVFPDLWDESNPCQIYVKYLA